MGGRVPSNVLFLKFLGRPSGKDRLEEVKN